MISILEEILLDGHLSTALISTKWVTRAGHPKKRHSTFEQKETPRGLMNRDEQRQHTRMLNRKVGIAIQGYFCILRIAHLLSLFVPVFTSELHGAK